MLHNQNIDRHQQRTYGSVVGPYLNEEVRVHLPFVEMKSFHVEFYKS